MIELIVARARNGVIGGDNKMLWRIPEDFAFFKKTTMGCPIIMGRRTWESIGRPLPGRRNIVVTRNPDFKPSGAETASSIEEALALVENDERKFIIGGANVYAQALPLASRAWITFVDEDFEGDAVFPDLDSKEWTKKVIDVLEPTEARPYKVEFTVWDRINS